MASPEGGRPDLSALGVEEGVVYELVAVTVGVDGRPHAAAMGCVFKRDELGWKAVSKLARSSVTSSNLLRNGVVVLNVVDEELLVEAALDLGVVEMGFEEVRGWEVPAVRGAFAAVLARAELLSQDETWNRFELRPVSLHLGEGRRRPFTRSLAALVEAAVHASRIPVFKGVDESRAEELRTRVRELLSLAERLGPTERIREICDAVRRKYLGE
ncbi:MAG: DUF447 family protein [Nitrososphaerota archaeon]